MRIEDVARIVGVGGLFTTGFLLSGEVSGPEVRRQLDRWVKSGKVTRLRRGVYMLNRPWSNRTAHPFVVANALSRGSCVSLQSALSWWGMIPEHVPVTTSVTTGRPEEVQTPIGDFLFRHLKDELFRDVREIEVSRGQHALVAGPGEALVGLLYLTPHSDDPGYLRELRLEPPHGVEEAIFVTELQRNAESTGSMKVQRAVRRLVTLAGWSDQV